MITLDELLENFSLFDDWEDRYQYLIDLGKSLPPMPTELKIEKNKVMGCTSQVWISVSPLSDHGVFNFLADSDAIIVRGLIGILRILYAEKKLDNLPDHDIDAIFAQLGLQQHLSVNRRNGFYAMVEKLKNTISTHKNTGQPVSK